MGALTAVGDALILYFGTISVVCGLIAFILGLIFDRSSDNEKRVTRAGAAITLPFGLVLIYAALDPTAFRRMAEIPRGPLFLGGIAILLTYFNAATSGTSKEQLQQKIVELQKKIEMLERTQQVAPPPTEATDIQPPAPVRKLWFFSR